MTLSLRAKFILISVAVQGLVLWALIWNSFRLMDEAVRKNATRLAHEYAVTLNLSLSPYANSGNLKILNAFMSELLSDPRDSLIRYVTVSDQTGKLILSVGKIPNDTPALFQKFNPENTASMKTELTGSVLNVTAPLMLQNNSIGSFNFGISTEDIEQTRSAILKQDILISIAGFLLGVLLLYFFTAGIGRRLSTLTRKSQKIAEGDFEEIVSERSGDELEVFSRTLNHMSLALRERIAQLVNAEQRLLESEERFKILFDTAPVSLMVTDDAGKFIAINQAWITTSGLARENVVGQPIAEIDFWRGPEEHQRVATINAQHKLVQGEVLSVNLAGGRFGEVAIWSSSLKLDGKKCQILALLDMTEELGSKRELNALNSTLENRVLERSSELALANKELLATLQTLKHTQSELIATEKMASLGSLVAGVAHELNTPIGNSLLASTTLLDRMNEFEQDLTKGAISRSKLVRYLHEISLGCELITGSLHRAANLINSFKQVAVDQTHDQRRVFDLQQVLQDILSAFAPRLRLANCTATLHVHGNFSLDSYPGSVGQVISNLINNALIHAFEGYDSGTIKISVTKLDEAWVEIDFSDNGAGMSDHVLRHVFDPFFTTKMGKGGSGLGMNIVYNIVLGVMGGRIDIQTAIGKGTSVKILLPLVAPTRERTRSTDMV